MGNALGETTVLLDNLKLTKTRLSELLKYCLWRLKKCCWGYIAGKLEWNHFYSVEML
jgi:hypothetical protein